MRLTVLGSGSCELIRERSSSSYLLEAGATALLLDLGQGALRRLLDLGRDPGRLAGVLITHLHLDHLADLLPLLFALRNDPVLSARAHLTLVADPAIGTLVGRLSAAFGPSLDVELPTLATELLDPGESLELGEIVIETARANHVDSSLAYRLEHRGRTLVYLGDSEASAEVERLATGADLLIAHCAAPDEAPRAGHLNPAAAGELAAAAGVGALVLSHFYRVVDPGAAEAAAAERFSGPVWAARDLDAYEVDMGGAQRVSAGD